MEEKEEKKVPWYRWISPWALIYLLLLAAIGIYALVRHWIF